MGTSKVNPGEESKDDNKVQTGSDIVEGRDCPNAEGGSAVIENSDAKSKTKRTVPIGQLYRYATTEDRILMVFGSICAMAVGCVFP